jgi:hypothetical protein
MKEAMRTSSRWGTRLVGTDVNIERMDRVFHLRADTSGVYDGYAQRGTVVGVEAGSFVRVVTFRWRPPGVMSMEA